MGDSSFPSVAEGNAMAEPHSHLGRYVHLPRTIPSFCASEDWESELGQLLVVLGVRHIVEQPSSSKLFRYPPMHEIWLHYTRFKTSEMASLHVMLFLR